jgi:hypothetical protein
VQTACAETAIGFSIFFPIFLLQELSDLPVGSASESCALCMTLRTLLYDWSALLEVNGVLHVSECKMAWNALVSIM